MLKQYKGWDAPTRIFPGLISPVILLILVGTLMLLNKSRLSFAEIAQPVQPPEIMACPAPEMR